MSDTSGAVPEGSSYLGCYSDSTDRTMALTLTSDEMTPQVRTPLPYTSSAGYTTPPVINVWDSYEVFTRVKCDTQPRLLVVGQRGWHNKPYARQ